MIQGVRELFRDVREFNTWVQKIEQQGSFTASLTGYASSPTGLMEWVKLGRRITLHAPTAITGTSNATSLTLTGLPEAITPSVDKRFLTELTDNGASVVALGVLSGTTITFYTDAPFSASGWTNSGSKGIPQGCQMSWLLET